MKKRLKWILPGALVIFALLQLFNPARTNPPVKSDFVAAAHPPAPVAAAIRAACYDCHSYETKWPWYARVAPVSWLIASDVNDGREHLDLSDWPAGPDSAARRLDRINEALDYREMPPKKYTLIHAGARLTEAQRKEIMDWTDAEAAKLRAGAKN
jgi:Haem-binding domain